VNDKDEQSLKFDENNKGLLNRLKFKLLQSDNSELKTTIERTSKLEQMVEALQADL